MPVQQSSNDIARVYTTTDRVAPYLAPHTIGAGADNPITAARVSAEILRFSRKIDGLAAAAGLFTPFPAIGSSNPNTPDPIADWVTYRVAAECCIWAHLGNRKARQPTMLLALADEILTRGADGRMQGSLLDDALQEFVTGEDYRNALATGQEFGQLGSGGYYRLRNKGLLYDATHPMVFLDASGNEVFTSYGYPSTSQYVVVVDASQSMIFLGNNTTIEAAAPSISYWFSWHDPHFGQARRPRFAGTAAFIAP